MKESSGERSGLKIMPPGEVQEKRTPRTVRARPSIGLRSTRIGRRLRTGFMARNSTLRPFRPKSSHFCPPSIVGTQAPAWGPSEGLTGTMIGQGKRMVGRPGPAPISEGPAIFAGPRRLNGQNRWRPRRVAPKHRSRRAGFHVAGIPAKLTVGACKSNANAIQQFSLGVPATTSHCTNPNR